MKLMTDRQVKLIVNNVVRACDDIEKLSSAAYKYLYLCSGFIAHYSWHGFKDYYHRYSLRDDIVDNAPANRWTNFRPNDEHYEYYQQKAEVYKQILDRIWKAV